MKILNKSLIGLIASVLCVCNASADVQPVKCPAGCFCLNNGPDGGEYYPIAGLSESEVATRCSQLSATTPSPLPSYVGYSCRYGSRAPQDVEAGHTISNNHSVPADFYFDEFSEFYSSQNFGFYGYINGDFVYGGSCDPLHYIYLCPESHPYSAAGAKNVTDCFKYKANGAKEYYGANNTVACNEGYYLPANSTQCAMCQPSMGHVCPGGSFEVTNQIQGLKVWCNPREYLPAGATQCSTCDDNVYSCAGGVYDFNPTEDQGRIKHNGYLDILHPIAANPNAQHKYSTCKPGYYRPAGSISCAECTGNYACPGGMFFDDVTYNVARGRILCGYGVPNANHSACVAQTTSPSKMKKKAENESNIESAKPAPSKKMDVVTKNTAGTLSRSLSQRPEAPSMNVTEPEVVNTKPVVSRSAKAVPQTNSVHESENVRERPDVRRPSRSHERGQR
jgi:hypothetical protein